MVDVAQPEYEVEDVIGHRREKGKNGRSQVRYEVLWTTGETTWEPRSNLSANGLTLKPLLDYEARTFRRRTNN
jgi:hypothetical protein